MNVVLVTGSGGLVGSESVRFFSGFADLIVGVDNDMRAHFFNEDASTRWATAEMAEEIENYLHLNVDIRDSVEIERLFSKYGSDISLIIHTAAQPSHDWAARDPITDFTVNANGTLVLLEAFRKHCPEAVFIFTSTNKVYGDTPNDLPLVEQETRWEVETTHPYFEHGVDEQMSIDHSKHSLFGASKLAADVLVQEYGRYFGLKTGVFRGGCLTGPYHSGAQLHGFLSYLMKCAMTGAQYTVLGYKGKQVRDNIHSEDLVSAFEEFYRNPRAGETYNIGGGRMSNCSLVEAIEICEQITGRKMNFSYLEENRIGDHIWWISDIRKFKSHYPNWKQKHDITSILTDIFEKNKFRWELALK